jgi:phenylalanyl-tRNA synthetase beta chain
VVEKIMKFNTKLIENIEVFDVYYGEGIEEGKRSMAIRVVYGAPDRTLTGEEVDKVHLGVEAILRDECKAVLRQ